MEFVINWLVDPHHYRGCPKEQLAALEGLLQATVASYWEQVQRMASLQKPWEYNQSYTFSKVSRRHPQFRSRVQNRMVLTDHAAGYWGVIEWDDNVFLLHCSDGSLPKKIPSWQKLHTKAGLGKDVGLHFEVTRNRDKTGWATLSYHIINLQHPLLWVLGRVTEEKEESC